MAEGGRKVGALAVMYRTSPYRGVRDYHAPARGLDETYCPLAGFGQ